MHVDDAFRAAALVQIIDILRDERQPLAEPLFKPRQRLVRSIRMNVLQRKTPRIVEGMNERRIAREAFRRRDIAIVVFRPDAIRIAKGRDAGIGGNPGAGENDDVAQPPDPFRTSGLSERRAFQHIRPLRKSGSQAR